MHLMIIYLILYLSQPFPARCWVGVIDHINPPWISVSKESGEEVLISLDESYPQAREGHWVIYWERQERLERLDSPHSRAEAHHQELLLRSLILSPKRGSDH